MLGDDEPSETATCAETRTYITENVPPEEFVKATDERQDAARHLSLRIMFGWDIPALEEDPLRDLAVAMQVAEILKQQSSVGHADRLDRALDFAARPDVSVEAAVMIGATVLGADPTAMPDWQARGYRGLKDRAPYRRFKARVGKYMPQF